MMEWSEESQQVNCSITAQRSGLRGAPSRPPKTSWRKKSFLGTRGHTFWRHSLDCAREVV
jgi:hypothetical protein